MSQGAAVKLLPLDEALTEWSDGQLLANVVRAERPFSPESLKAKGRLHLGGARAEYVPGKRVAADYMRTESALLDMAWRELVGEFSRKIDREQLFLYGVPGAAQGEAERELIPNAFAADLEFDFVVGSAHRGARRWVSVRCTPGRLDARPTSTGPMGSAQSELRLEDLPHLPDELAERLVLEIARRRGWPGVDSFLASELGSMNSEQVIALLERHAEDVVRETGISLQPTGKVSPLALIARKMAERARGGEMFDTLATEADWLAAWASRAAPSHHQVMPKTISNKLNRWHADLKRSHPRRD